MRMERRKECTTCATERQRGPRRSESSGEAPVELLLLLLLLLLLRLQPVHMKLQVQRLALQLQAAALLCKAAAVVSAATAPPPSVVGCATTHAGV